MSLDLTGGLLVSFLLGEILPALSRHPRFRTNAGETFTVFSNTIMFNDVSVTLGNLRGETTRLSPDYFVGTLFGRATMARLEGKAGAFLEWLREVDPSQATPEAGVYQLHVDSVNEQTREVRFIRAATRSVYGAVESADGTVIGVDPSIPIELVHPQDTTLQFERSGTRIYLQTFTNHLDLVRADTGTVLSPGSEWWLERTCSITLTDSTAGGSQVLDYPDTMVNMQVLDGDGDTLRAGSDWKVTPDGRIELADWTPAGEVRTARGVIHVTPTDENLVHPENFLTVVANPGETVVPSSLRIVAPDTTTVTTSTGAICLKQLLMPGESLRWDALVASAQVYATAKKMEMAANLIPGLNLAIGDLVEVGDQCCILVSPDECETHEVYGGKDNVSVDITVKANDLMTAGELAGIIKRYLLIEGRDRMESAGVTIYSAPYSYQGDRRDESGAAATHSVVLNVSLAADWEYYKPLVNRVSAVDLDLVVTTGRATPGVSVGGRTAFVTSYA